MQDQAKELRRLVHQVALPRAPAAAAGPRLIVVCGGKGGVGTITIALSLSAELARLDQDTVLVDADPDGGDVAVLCGIEEHHTMAEVLSARRTVRQSLQNGPQGVQLLPGAWGLDVMADCSTDAQERLVTQLRGLGPDVHVVVIDVGSGTSSLVKRFWQAADEILLVTTSDLTSVMDTYATAKVLAAGADSLRIRPVVNFAPDPGVADSVHARLARAFQRFLGIRLLPSGHVPHDQRVRQGNASVQQVKALAEKVLGRSHASSCVEGNQEKTRNRTQPSDARCR